MSAVTVDNLVIASGTDCKRNGELMYATKSGKNLTTEEAWCGQTSYNKFTGLIKKDLGNFQKINRIVKLLSFVKSEEGFNEQPLVASGASDFLEADFEEKSKHARSSVDVSELPFSIPARIKQKC